MPGSLLGPKVRRSDSARSDHSDVSGYSADSRGKKVSFNKAVRVKKYPRRQSSDSTAPDEKRFWFKVYKNRNTDGAVRNNKAIIDGLEADQSDYSENDSGFGRLDTIDERDALLPKGMIDVGVGTTLRHSSQEADQPRVRRNHVRRLVHKFNEEAALKENDDSPQDPPVDYADSYLDRNSQLIKPRKNPLINGVKVIFGMKPLKKREDNQVVNKNARNLRHSREKLPIMNGHVSTDPKGPHKTSIVLADESTRDKHGTTSKSSRRSKENEIVPREHNNNSMDDTRLKTLGQPILIDTWDSGDQLVSDVNRYESTVDKNSDGEFYKTVEEEQKVWKNVKRMVYEEPSPLMLSERRAKSHSDLRYENNRLEDRGRFDKVLSSEELSREPYYSSSLTVDRGVQCNRNREQKDRVLTPSKYRVIQSKDGYVSAYSDVPLLSEEESVRTTTTNNSTLRNGHSDAIYSQVDKSKKKKKKQQISVIEDEDSTNPPSRNESPVSKNSRYLNDGHKTMKTSHKSFGFRLKKAFGGKQEDKNTYIHNDCDWYDVDVADTSTKRQNGHYNHYDIAEVRAELDDDFSSVADEGGSQKGQAPSSVIRDMDAKKREINYENVPHQNTGRARDFAVGGGTWFRGADEDYRREMAQSDVSFPSGSHVGSSATLGRIDKKSNGFREEETVPKSFTLDRRHMKDKKNEHSHVDGGVKILVNGHEIDDVDHHSGHKKHHRRSKRKENENNLPSSVQSDPVVVRGGLAAAYKARQKAAIRRSNSTTGSGLFGNRLSPNGKARYHHGSSGGSIVSSSDSDSARRRRTLVMYIPGVNHQGKKPSDGLSRTQSMIGQKHKGSRGHLSPSEDDEDGDTLTPLKSDVKKSTKGGDSLRRREIRRRHSMPKDTKFGWFKWKIKGKPSREP